MGMTNMGKCCAVEISALKVDTIYLANLNRFQNIAISVYFSPVESYAMEDISLLIYRQACRQASLPNILNDYIERCI